MTGNEPVTRAVEEGWAGRTAGQYNGINLLEPSGNLRNRFKQCYSYVSTIMMRASIIELREYCYKEARPCAVSPELLTLIDIDSGGA